MESTDLNSDSRDDTPVDSWLRANAGQPVLADDGFSARVLAALPARTLRNRSPRRTWLWLSGALLGCAIAAYTGGSWAGTADQSNAFAAISRAVSASLEDPSLLLAAIVTAGSLAVVYRRELISKLSR